jgi:predicted helicase
MSRINLKPSHKIIKDYYAALTNYSQLGFFNEGSVSPPFAVLLESAAKQAKWSLVQQYPKKVKGKSLRIDGAVVDQWGLPHGYWEAKDAKDDLRKEVKNKFAVGYPRDNIIFQEPGKAILWQNEKEVAEFDLLNADELVRLIELFFDYVPPAFDEWEQAAKKFHEQLPELGEALLKVLDDAKVNNKAFQTAFAAFYELCRTSINPNLSEKAVEEMLIQHLLTERIFRTVFQNSEFTQRNAIAKEIETVILALTSQSFSREEFLKRFDHFYKAVEQTASTIDSFPEKQTFLNNIYERFFQGFSVDVADTHGIVYTPQPIVNFMVKSVEDILQKEFGKSLSDENVHILDPFVGTGNFMVHIIDEIKKTSLELKYANELHCNEVMLLPYYIASMNIEHEYFEKVGQYEPFGGICLVDTFDMAERKQAGFAFVTEENTERIQRQRNSPITVVIGNPPYNAWQLNENDNNKNRKYEKLDKDVSITYAKDSNASLKNSLSDPYVKAIRWATNRIEDDGIVAFVTNNGFIDSIAFDGMRKHLAQDFNKIYVLDLGGNVRKNPKLSGTTHNVFGIQVGVSINLFVRNSKTKKSTGTRIFYAATETDWRKEQKYKFLDERENVSRTDWNEIKPDAKYSWLTTGLHYEFDQFVPIGNKQKKSQVREDTIFKSYSLGVSSKRDATVFNYNKSFLKKGIKDFINAYNSEVHRYVGSDKPADIDGFVNYEKLKWSMGLKKRLENEIILSFDQTHIRKTLFRPFSSSFLYFDHNVVDVIGLQANFFPADRTESDNRAIYVTDKGSRSPFSALATNRISESHLCATTDSFQCFSFYVYNEDGTNRRENITDWGLEQFREHYADKSVNKWDIFYYTYAILHHPEYREKYAANLKRELPRIPFAPDFWSFAKAGKELADIHVGYEDQPEYKLDMIEHGKLALDWRVDRMKYNKDKTAIVYNDFLTIGGIPPEVHQYRLGNRSALDWIVDQYKVSIDKRSGITNDPNREDDPQYIVRLIKKIVTVSLRTNELVASLPPISAA